MIPGTDHKGDFTRKGVFMESYCMGIDVSKGYADFVILDANKNVVEPNFQLDDTFSSHCKLETFAQLHKTSNYVIPVKAVIQYYQALPGFRFSPE